MDCDGCERKVRNAVSSIRGTHIYIRESYYTSSLSLFKAGPVKLVNTHHSCKKLKTFQTLLFQKGFNFYLCFVLPSTLAAHFLGLYLWLLGARYIYLRISVSKSIM